jgi:hypothetical protein
MPTKDTETLKRRREMVVNRVSQARNPTHEIQRIAYELYLDKSTIYRDLENSGYKKEKEED